MREARDAPVRPSSAASVLMLSVTSASPRDGVVIPVDLSVTVGQTIVTLLCNRLVTRGGGAKSQYILMMLAYAKAVLYCRILHQVVPEINHRDSQLQHTVRITFQASVTRFGPPAAATTPAAKASSAACRLARSAGVVEARVLRIACSRYSEIQ